MRKFLISIALASTVMTAAPAMAQYRGDHGRAEWNRGGPSRQAINELLRDLQRAPEFDQSALFKKVYEEEYGVFGGTPSFASSSATRAVSN